jgi:RNA polymerase sigma factor (sigma-70 family)
MLIANLAAPQGEDAWAGFLTAYSNTLLRVCRSVTRDQDLAMDAYTFVVEALRADGCRRLQTYVAERDVRFASWLTVVARRLAVDFVRRRYGRLRSSDADCEQRHRTRRHLEDLRDQGIDPDTLISQVHDDPDLALRRREVAEHLSKALAQLSSTDRLLLALRFEDDRPVCDIARILGLPNAFHVYRRLKSALSSLRDCLRNCGIEDAEP